MSGRGESSLRSRSGCFGGVGSVFAVLTPPGRGGIAVIRCVGPGVEAALARCFRPAARGKALPDAGAILYGHVVDAEDQPLDEVLLCRTADQAFEVNCHGGPAAVEAVCGRLESLGLARADADRLLQVEGIGRVEREARRALREVTTPLAARILLDQLNGALATALSRVHGAIEARHADEGLAALDALLARWRGCGRFLARPPRIAIAGLPNSGKSTLLNRLVGAERVITSPLPGTTRDAIAAEAALPAQGGPAWGGAGLPVVLVDTAGLREACGEVERAGVARAKAELAQADLVVWLLDAAAGRRPEDDAALAALSDLALAVWNKADAIEAARPAPSTGSGQAGRGTLRISALTGEGVEELSAAILARLGYAPTEPGEAVPFTVEQASALEAARQALAADRAADAAHAVKALLG